MPARKFRIEPRSTCQPRRNAVGRLGANWAPGYYDGPLHMPDPSSYNGGNGTVIARSPAYRK